MHCREGPAEHVLLNRTVEQLVELPGKKYMFTAEQSEVRTIL